MRLYKRGFYGCSHRCWTTTGDLKLAYSLMLTLPGTPVFRYGDEIGMDDNLELHQRNSARTPMQWSTEPHRVRHGR